MTLFYDKDGNGYIAQMNLTRTIDVSGNISISGTIFNGDDVLQNVGYGWSFKFQDEKYVISYTKLNDEDNTVEFDAVHKFLWDFSKSVFYENWTGSHTFAAYLDALFSGSGYTYDLQTTVAAFEKDNWGMKNKADLLSDIISDAGVELEISNLKVTIKAQIGSDLTSIARYGINLSDLIEENNISNFATHGKGFGAYYDEDDTSKGRLEVEYTSDLAETYGILDLDPIVDERYTISDNLLAAVKSGVDATFAVSVSLNMYDLENAGYPNYDSPQVGDWILAIDEKLNFKRKVRIIKLEEEFDANEKRIGYSVTAGDLSQAEQLQSAQVSATNAIQQLQQDVITVYYAANGKNRTFTGTDDPNTLGLTNLISGDIYWRTNGNKKELWIYDGTRWNQEVTDATGVEITAKVDTAMADVDTAKQDAQTAVDTANTSIAQSGLAIANAQNAADTAIAVQQQVITLKGGSTLTIAELESGLSTKVSSDDFNSYRTQIDSALVDKVSSADFTSYRTQTDAAIQDRITTADAQALVTTTANTWQANLTTLQTQVNNSAVGTNLLLNSAMFDSNWSLDTGITLTSETSSVKLQVTSTTGNRLYQSSQTSSGEYQVSIYASVDAASVESTVKLALGPYQNPTIISISGTTLKRYTAHISWLSSNSNSFSLAVGGVYSSGVVGDIVHVAKIKLEKGSVATDYSANPADNATTVALTAVNTSLTSAINLRVQKNDVINQINVSSEGILIDGAKVHITGTTTIGNAVIKSAMIDSLSASKLTAGTIDASVISVINLNASSITSGTLTGVTFHQSSTNSDTWINDDGISNYNNTNSYVRIRNGNISAYTGTGDGMFMDSGELFLTTYSLWANSGKGGTPQYGQIGINSDLFSSGGVQVSGNGGFTVKTSNSNVDSLSNSPWTSSQPTGAFIGGTSAGNILMASNLPTLITAGSRYSTTSGGYPAMPYVQVGGAVSNAGDTSHNGSSIILSGYDTLINADNGNISLAASKGNIQITGGGFIATAAGSHIRNTQIDNELWVNGNFSVSGTKNAVVETSKGWTQINAYETAEYYFGDIDKVNTGSGSKVKIVMDSLFLETVNTKVGYHVFLSSYGNGYAWISEQGTDYFIIESSSPNLDVSYEIKAKRIGYEVNRLEIDEDFEQKFDTAS
ncbi:phage tail protein [Liquorilactobacillus sp.]|uniref:phage tail protein n=1 Tax=Liquorilactobacillus sp. TaxID=2767923 RepID=UPI0039EA7644